jgi:hypothetical protein
MRTQKGYKSKVSELLHSKRGRMKKTVRYPNCAGFSSDGRKVLYA